MFDYSMEERASDVHIEPNREYVIMRFRTSGDFIFVDKISHEEYAKLISRIKILANLRIDEKYRPQDGKIAYTSEKWEESIDVRVSILPLVEGEKVVMRILRQDTSLLSLDKLDFLDQNLERIKWSLASRYGIILVAGPTGSGKSTTLFSMLKSFDPLEFNISTLEDPVEYNIPFINQSQVKPQIGFDFAAGLRSLVRQDPDIIMVGEIRDKETAMLAIEAALTGHLVLSTIHTNSAAGTIQRLINMGVEPFLISSALKMVISQRLVKRLCPHCASASKLESGPTMDTIHDALMGVFEEEVHEMEYFSPKGCEKCDNTGYKGRVGVHEVLTMNEALNPLILGKASVQELESKARELGMLTIFQDALIKSLAGKTSLEESLQLL
jgi:type IV pilus assembly protein PilB